MAVTNNKSSSSYNSKSLSKDLATAKAKTTGMNTSLINSAGTAQKLARASRAGTTTGKPTESLDASIESLPEMTPTTAPITPTPAVAPIQAPPTQAPGAITPQDALKEVKASGLPAPQDSAEGREAVSKMMPGATGASFWKPSPTAEQVYSYDQQGNWKALSYDDYIAAGGRADFSNVQAGTPEVTAIDQMLAQDKGYQQLLKDKQELDSVVNQQKSLTDTYNELTKSLGIPALNTELMNMKNVIEGTEDNIREEITKAGGFATESQVQALSSSRNKVLIQNYNNLLQTKSQVMDTLNVMMGLAEKDKALARENILQKMGINQQLYEYEQRMQTNAVNKYQDIISKVGYSGLLAMTGGDVFYQNMIEKTLGLPKGGLAKTQDVAQAPVKFETVTIGSGKGNIKVRYGYDGVGNIVSATNLNTGQPYGGSSSAQAYSSPRGNPSPSPRPPSTAKRDARVKQIISLHPGEWGNAADQIDREFGRGTATIYDDLLKKSFTPKTTTKTSQTGTQNIKERLEQLLKKGQ